MRDSRYNNVLRFRNDAPILVPFAVLILAVVLMPASALAEPPNGDSDGVQDVAQSDDPASDEAALPVTLNWEMRKVSEGHRFVEGPAVSPDGRIYFSDIPDSEILIYDPATGETSVFSDDSGRSNGLFFFEGALYACEGGRRVVVRYADPHDVASREVLVEHFEGRPFNSPNDLAITSDGAIHFTDPRYGNRESMDLDVEAVYTLSPEGRVVRQGVFERPNGIATQVMEDDPNEFRMIVADHEAREIHRWMFVDGERVVSPESLWAVIDPDRGGVDGMWFDTHGRLYCTVPQMSLVVVFDESGLEVGRIEFPEGPANVVLTPDESKMYVTAQSSLYEVDVAWDD